MNKKLAIDKINILKNKIKYLDYELNEKLEEENDFRKHKFIKEIYRNEVLKCYELINYYYFAYFYESDELITNKSR